ncbi:hypothetical protein [Ancylobacter polymorphus]|uniref:Uncharacterized protein n=1 Tax=Ancylobacter polymorphus TaxID=223390 RepID=A0ABU0BHH0_9HYPH|nr:hypothetical protein [Ancylobacter polymorphus]MDQ0305280.1 hypothetical protein [Ancylobacter polymorphus]
MTENTEPTPEERRAIATLERLAKCWPKSLWLFSASGLLCVMRNGPDGSKAHVPGGGIDPDYILATIDISNDGGDW